MRNEDRDIWRAKLEKGEYADALNFAKVSNSQFPRSPFEDCSSFEDRHFYKRTLSFLNKVTIYSNKDGIFSLPNVTPRQTGALNTSRYDSLTRMSEML